MVEMEEEVGGCGVECRSRWFDEVVVASGLKFDDPIELEEVLWRLICVFTRVCVCVCVCVCV